MTCVPANAVTPSTAAKVTGPAGGFGWQMYLDKGAPKVLNISAIQVRGRSVAALPSPNSRGYRSFPGLSLVSSRNLTRTL
jgi:hypothetical protein